LITSYRNSLRALKSALRHLFHPTILGVLLVPAIGAILVWAGLSWWFWDSWTGGIESGLVNATSDGWIASLELSRFAGFAAVLTVLLLIVPAILRLKGGTFAGSIVNAVTSVSAFVLLWVLTLPLWLLLGPLAIVVPLALSAYLNQRLFRYDALSEHASKEEMQRIFSQRFSDLFVLGLLTGALYFVPVVNLIAPVFSALAFTCLCLDELARIRGEGAASTGS
jgi:uncharacterized protein involved in cysteine biosynthesis